MQHVTAENDFLRAPPIADVATTRRGFDGQLATTLRRARDYYEDRLDFVHRWTAERKFHIATLWLQDKINCEQAGNLFSALAEAVVSVLLPQALTGLAGNYGRILRGRFVVVAFGKLGSREMTAQSDLDLVFIYDVPDDVEASDGSSALEPSAYYAKIGQRLIGALSAQTANGALYDVDMRLRPFGDSGPITSSLASFRRYYRHDAWTWEHMALTRAGVIAGDDDLAERVRGEIATVLGQPRDPHRLVADVADMRWRMMAQHKSPAPWNVKHRPGGLIDIEFIAQYLQLRHGGVQPGVLSPSTRSALGQLTELGCLDPRIATDLITALSFWQEVQGSLRVMLGRDGEGKADPDSFEMVLARVTGLSDPAQRLRFADDMAAMVRSHYEALVDRPAAE